MTIGTVINSVTAQGNGVTTAFGYPFLIPAASDASVIYTNASGVQTVLTATQYTITGIGSTSGGTVTYPLSGSPITASTYVTVERVLPLIQATSISNQGPTFGATESEFDYQMMCIQQINNSVVRSVQGPATDPTGLTYALPSAASRANQLLGFDANGNVIAAEPSSALVSSIMQPVVAAASTFLASAQMSTLYPFSSIAALRAESAASAPPTVWTEGYYNGADQGDGPFFYSSSDTSSTDNNGTIIVDAAGRRWHRQTGGDPISVKWFGATGNGTTTDSAAFTAAMSINANGIVTTPPGNNFKLGSALTGTASALLSLGSSFVDPSNLPGPPQDTTVWGGNVPFSLLQSMALAGTSTTGSANQFLANIQSVAQSTSHLAPYEKGSLYINAQCNDNSTYSTASNNTADMVGIETHAVINCATGRVWGQHITAEVNPRSDGYLIGLEIEVANNGTNETGIANAEFAKHGIHLVADGPNPVTTAIRVTPNGSTFNFGLIFDGSALTSGGAAMIMPNLSPLAAWSTTGVATSLVLLDTNNIMQIGNGCLYVASDTILLPQTDNTFSLGISTNRWTAVWAVNGSIQTSDVTQKSNVKSAPDVSSVLNAVKPITHGWKEKDDPTFSGDNLWGFDAKEVKDAFAAAGHDFGGVVTDENGTHHIAPMQMVAALWRIVQEQSRDIATLKAKLA